jgi:hypothetical protein
LLVVLSCGSYIKLEEREPKGLWDVEYIYVEWMHNFSDEPIILISELDENRFETRKIEVYKDGQVGLPLTMLKY